MADTNIRIQKVLSDNGIMSRRKAEAAVEQGRITVNGHKATIGQKINPKKDIIAIDGVRVEINTRGSRKIYMILNKPRGYVTTTQDEQGRKCVMDLVADAPERVYPVGRLDRNSEGLLIMTNDGELANDIMHPSGHVSKTYRVTVHSEISEQQIIDLSTGIMLDNKMTSPAVIHVLSREPGRGVLQVTIHEGRNRQVRRMCEAVGFEVARLKRTSIGPIRLGMLPPGKWRELKPAEIIALKGSVQKAKRRSDSEAENKAK